LTKTRVITQQILSSSEARPTKMASSSEWSVRFPIQTVIFDNEGIEVRKLDAQEASPDEQHRRICFLSAAPPPPNNETAIPVSIFVGG
jgi:hypothetical protein